MFDKFQSRMEEGRDLGLGPQPQAGQDIIDRAIALGAVSPSAARSRAEIDPHTSEEWAAILACGYLRQSRPGVFYVSADGSAEQSLIVWTPFRIGVAIAVLLGLLVALLKRI
ncbi:MAG: hypothetical protein ABJE47_21085 [bacterium]